MTAYGSIDQLVARWRPLTDEESDTAEVLLEDASVQIRSEIPDLRSRIDAGDIDLLSATIRVECAMVKRAMTAADDGGFGVTSSQETQGPFSRTFQYSNPMGDLYLTKAERRLLGGGRARAFTIDQSGGPTLSVIDELAYVRAASLNSDGLTGFVV